MKRVFDKLARVMVVTCLCCYISRLHVDVDLLIFFPIET